MNRLCTRCRFHREFRLSLIDRLQRDIGPAETEVVDALTRLAQEQGQRRDAETSQLRELARQDESQWSIRPEMTSYCGLDEARDVYYVAGIKNPGGECGDFEAIPPAPPRECVTCRHRIAATGPERDQAHVARLRDMAVTAAAIGQPTGLAGLDELRRWMTTTKVREVTQAFHERQLSQRPRYLSICAKHSRGARFVPCAVHNTHDACADWSSIAAAATASPLDGWGLLRPAPRRGKP